MIKIQSKRGYSQMTMPTIPKSEYPPRWQTVQQLMVAKELDLLLAYVDDRAVFGAAPSSSQTLQENMVISIDIPMFNTPWGELRIEDGYLITSTGYEPLSNIDKMIVL